MEVLCRQFLLAGLQLGNKCLLVSSQHHLQGTALSAVLGFPHFPHQFRIPRRVLEHATQEGIAEGVALPGPETVAQHTQLGDVQLRDVHVQVHGLVQPFNVNASLARNHYFLCRHRQRDKTQGQEKCSLHHDSSYILNILVASSRPVPLAK